MAEARTGLMAGKRGLIMGVANDHSIAWGIAQLLASHGDGMVVGHAHDQAALSGHQSRSGLGGNVGDGKFLFHSGTP